MSDIELKYGGQTLKLARSEQLIALEEQPGALSSPELATPGKLHAFSLPIDSLLREQWHLENTASTLDTRVEAVLRLNTSQPVPTAA